MNYTNKAKEIFKDIFKESWMSEEDYYEIESEVLKELNINYEKLGRDLEQGVKNGYSIEFQTDLMKKVFKKLDSN